MVTSSDHAEFPVIYGVPSNDLTHKRSSSLEFVPDESDHEDLEEEGSDLEDRIFTLKDYQEYFHLISQRLVDAGPDITEEWQQMFKNSYDEYPRPQVEGENLTTEQKTFLYKITRDGPALPWLMGHVFENHPRLLDQRDPAGRNGLLPARTSKQIEFMKSVLSSGISKLSLSKALTALGDSVNCIHQAIVNNLEPEVTVQLIEAASEETLATQDGNGLTPLHCAVDYIRCTKSRLRVIQALLRCGNQALDKVDNSPGAFSPYCHHLETKIKYEQSRERKETHPSSRHHDEVLKKLPLQGLLEKADITSTIGSAKRTNNMAQKKGKDHKKSSKKKIFMGTSMEPPSPQIAEEVVKELKLHYLRMVFSRALESVESHASEPRGPWQTVSAIRTHDSAIKFLYADNKDGMADGDSNSPLIISQGKMP